MTRPSRAPYSFVLASLVCLFTVPAIAQNNIRLNAGFLADSLKIGEETAFYLSAHYPREATVLFPDSTSAYFPFEYLRKEFFPTVTRDSVSKDSAVYYITTFEVERVQYLYLPVYHVMAEDCTAYYSPTDSVLITQMVSSVPDSVGVAALPLLMNTTYEPVRHEFNYIFLIAGIGVLVVIALVVWIIFGKQIRRYFRSRTLIRNHAAFVTKYDAVLSQLETASSAGNIESALSVWKRYMEQLEARPYSKLTTRETLVLLRDETLGNNLRQVDRAIYGHGAMLVEPLASLRAFADQRFNKKLEEVKHGK